MPWTGYQSIAGQLFELTFTSIDILEQPVDLMCMSLNFVQSTQTKPTHAHRKHVGNSANHCTTVAPDYIFFILF